MFVLPQINKVRKRLLLSTNELQAHGTRIDPTQLYNFLQDVELARLLIDARPFFEYEKAFIKTAINVDLTNVNSLE
jgi:predicted sulfurtransferase